MTESTADPGLVDWNIGSTDWYGLEILVRPAPETWYHGGAIAGARSELVRAPKGYTRAIVTNSEDAGGLGSDLDLTMIQTLGSGLEGSASGFDKQCPSPALRSPVSGRPTP